MGGHEGWWGFGGGIMMWLFWILFVVLVVWLIKAAAGSGGSDAGRPPQETPLEILKKRYARGEIDDEEFQRRKRELER